ncbi:putative NAD-dependent epimerase/dehydratase [Xylariaceae sp. FL0255]|nr:putative NAD-dependent epimerase/dehydratase [Xylariaceae sp. FL0255]
MSTYAVLGATGNCGTALIQTILDRPDTRVHAYCRNKAKLLRLLPQVKSEPRCEVFEGSIGDIELLKDCVQDCTAVFQVVSTNDNIPGCQLSQDTAKCLIKVLEGLKSSGTHRVPKVILLSSATLDEHLSRHTPRLLRKILLCSASYVYNDLRETERLFRAQEDWLTTIYIKPGALSIDEKRGHVLSLTDEESPLSYLDLAGAMIEAADDEEGKWDMRNVGVINKNGRAKFPSGTPVCILLGLARHFFPFLHPYLPSGFGP